MTSTRVMAKTHDNSHGSAMDKCCSHRLRITSMTCSECGRYRSASPFFESSSIRKYFCLSFDTIAAEVQRHQTHEHWRRLATAEGMSPQPWGAVQYRKDWGPLLAAWSSVRDAKEQYATASGKRPRSIPTLFHS
jgi:hypothetical protein